MIFLTVGTQFPFDRLVKAVDDVIAQNGFKEKIFAQIGSSSYRPHNFEAVSSLEKKVFDQYICESSGIISHAGMGTITAALEFQKPLLVMPRLKKYREVVNDHQVAICRKFEQLGHLLVAHNGRELAEGVIKLKNFIPKPRTANSEAVINRIRQFLDDLGS